VRLSAYFENASGVAADPTAVTFSYGVVVASPPPDPTATTAVFGVDVNVIKDSTGRYHYDFTPSAPGIYRTRVVGTGAVAAAAVGGFRVKPSPFA
jgi:hypothetical protein